MLPCFGDIDVGLMFHLSNELAIPEGTAPPTHLPAEFHSRVKVFDIIDSEFPGYVYLVSSYLLTECTDDGNYNAVQCRRRYAEYTVDIKRHGPAVTTDPFDVPPTQVVGRVTGSQFTVDHVYRAYAVCFGRHKPLIGQHDTETTTG